MDLKKYENKAEIVDHLLCTFADVEYSSWVLWSLPCFCTFFSSISTWNEVSQKLLPGYYFTRTSNNYCTITYSTHTNMTRHRLNFIPVPCCFHVPCSYMYLDMLVTRPKNTCSCNIVQMRIVQKVWQGKESKAYLSSAVITLRSQFKFGGLAKQPYAAF